MTPALTTDDWMVPSALDVETTTSPWSNGMSSMKAVRSVIGTILAEHSPACMKSAHDVEKCCVEVNGPGGSAPSARGVVGSLSAPPPGPGAGSAREAGGDARGQGASWEERVRAPVSALGCGRRADRPAR